MAQRTILVTGGAGFIGSHACDALLAEGYRVRCLDNFATGKRDNVAHLTGHTAFEMVEGDIRSEADVQKAVSCADAVIHLAALGSVPRSIADPIASHRVNLEGFLQVLQQTSVAGIKRFVYASSSSVYGDSKELPKREENIGEPLSPYAVTKQGNELYARLYHSARGMEVIGLRFFNVFGERQDPEGPYAAAIPRFIKALRGHQPPVIFGDGLQSRDFTYVGNAVQAILAALRTDDERAFGDVFNVAYGARTTLLELVDELRAAVAKADPKVALVRTEHAPERAGDIRDSLADVSKAREVLRYAPQVDLRTGLERAVPWYLAQWNQAVES
ncbi:MAG: SDR family oxidoreductase [Flavobacteriales bacterium]|nr:SDR family oxidoreductase [Flavobacteriales bacterium]